MTPSREDVAIGRVVAPFGRRGEVKALPLTDYPERFGDLVEVRLEGKGFERTLRIEGVRHHKRAVIIKFEGVDDISAAETLRGAMLMISHHELAPLGDDEFYVHDVLGLEVITESGERLGTLREIIRAPANDVYVTDRGMIPAVKEFVREIDIKGKRMVVRPIPGMIED